MIASLTITLVLNTLNVYTQTSQPYLAVSLTKTACYGQCPVYNFKLYSDCTATYNGTAFTDKIGDWKSKLTKKQFNSIIAEFKRSDFFEFKDRYYSEISDLPTTYLYYSDSNRDKKIMDYYGAPQELKDLEAMVEGLIDKLEWQQVETNN